MLNSNSILLPTRAIFFLKIPFNQVTEDVKFDAFRYCHRHGLLRSGFFKIKEGIIGFPEEDYTHNILCEIARKYQMDMDVILFTNFEFLPLDNFPVIKQSLINGALTIQHWNFEDKNR